MRCPNTQHSDMAVFTVLSCFSLTYLLLARKSHPPAFYLFSFGQAKLFFSLLLPLMKEPPFVFLL